MKKSSYFLIGFLTILANYSIGQVIDFENDSFVEGTEIFDQYSGIPCGVKFYIGPVSDNIHPIIATVGGANGSNGTAFNGVNRSEPDCGINSNTTANMPALGENVGCKFLTDPDGTANSLPDKLNVVYDNVTYKASGYLLDVDGNEQWTITVHTDINSTSPVANSVPIILNGGGNLNNDGKALYWEFNFEAAGTPFKRIEIEHTGTSSSVGLAFDNFSACSTQEDDCCCEEILQELEDIKGELNEIKDLLKKKKKN